MIATVRGSFCTVIITNYEEFTQHTSSKRNRILLLQDSLVPKGERLPRYWNKGGHNYRHSSRVGGGKRKDTS